MRVLVTACLLSIVICGVARAAEPGADELITRGLELRRQAKPEQALEMFQRAHALAPSPRTLGQMGLVEASLEHWLDAETHLTAISRDAGRRLDPQEPNVPRSGFEDEPGPRRGAGHHRPRRHRCRHRRKARRHLAGRSAGEAGARKRDRDRERRGLQRFLEDGRHRRRRQDLVGDRARPGREAARGRAGGACPAASVVPAATVGDGASRPYLENGDGDWPRRRWCRTAGMGNHLDRRGPQRRLSDERRRLQQRLRHQDRRLDSDRRRCRGSRRGHRAPDLGPARAGARTSPSPRRRRRCCCARDSDAFF